MDNQIRMLIVEAKKRFAREYGNPTRYIATSVSRWTLGDMANDPNVTIDETRSGNKIWICDAEGHEMECGLDLHRE